MCTIGSVVKGNIPLPSSGCPPHLQHAASCSIKDVKHKWNVFDYHKGAFAMKYGWVISCFYLCRHSSVKIMTSYGLDGWGIGFIHGRGKRLYPSPQHPDQFFLPCLPSFLFLNILFRLSVWILAQNLRLFTCSENEVENFCISWILCLQYTTYYTHIYIYMPNSYLCWDANNPGYSVLWFSTVHMLTFKTSYWITSAFERFSWWLKIQSVSLSVQLLLKRPYWIKCVVEEASLNDYVSISQSARSPELFLCMRYSN